LYLPNKSDFPTTVASLIAIVSAAKNGRKLYISGPENGTNTPDAIGTKSVLYSNAFMVSGENEQQIQNFNNRHNLILTVYCLMEIMHYSDKLKHKLKSSFFVCWI